MAKQNPNANQQGGPQGRPIGNYNTGGQAGESVQDGGQRPADQPGGPFLGKSAMSTKRIAPAGNPNPDNPPPGCGNPGKTDTPGAKGKQDARQNPKL
jgi:hypothetical protein